jgi:hypothetical protein
MSSVTVAPEFVSQAAGQLENLGSALNAAHATAAAPTTGVLAPAADEVSAAITALMNSSAQEYQALSAQAATFHSKFVGLLSGVSGAYVATEAASTNGLSSQSAAETPTISSLFERYVATIDAAEVRTLNYALTAEKLSIEDIRELEEAARLMGLNSGAGAYSSTEAANVNTPLGTVTIPGIPGVPATIPGLEKELNAILPQDHPKMDLSLLGLVYSSESGEISDTVKIDF